MKQNTHTPRAKHKKQKADILHKQALGLVTGEIYSADNIKDDDLYISMLGEPLKEVKGRRRLRPVRPDGGLRKAHFRERAGQLTQRIGRRETTPTHNVAIKQILERLKQGRVRIYYTDRKGVHDLVHIVTSSEYDWNCDPRTRLERNDEAKTYIQPDIVGVYRGKSSGKPKLVIIEVIWTHEPEDATLLALLELSKERDALVIFYFVSESKTYSPHNRCFPTDAGCTSLMTTFYIDGGRFFRKGQEIGRKKGESEEHWRKRIRVAFLNWSKDRDQTLKGSTRVVS